MQWIHGLKTTRVMQATCIIAEIIFCITLPIPILRVPRNQRHHIRRHSTGHDRNSLTEDNAATTEDFDGDLRFQVN
jgi:hypothetical protein